jgi:HptB-dependent secretion and biofilm anti anti-sigma factor
MNIDVSFSEDDAILIISIKGKFDFSLLNEFRQAYTQYKETTNKAIVDMRSTSTIDSSALGMLLNMQRYLGKADGEVSIINCNQDVRKVFQITRFDKKFNIE